MATVTVTNGSTGDPFYDTTITLGNTIQINTPNPVFTTVVYPDPIEEFENYFKNTEYPEYVYFDVEKMRSAVMVGYVTFNEGFDFIFEINNWCVENDIELPKVRLCDNYSTVSSSGSIAFGFKTKEDLLNSL